MFHFDILKNFNELHTTDYLTLEAFGVFEIFLITLGIFFFDDQIKIYPPMNKFVLYVEPYE